MHAPLDLLEHLEGASKRWILDILPFYLTSYTQTSASCRNLRFPDMYRLATEQWDMILDPGYTSSEEGKVFLLKVMDKMEPQST